MSFEHNILNNNNDKLQLSPQHPNNARNLAPLY